MANMIKFWFHQPSLGNPILHAALQSPPREEIICSFCCKTTGDEKHYLAECENEIFVTRYPNLTNSTPNRKQGGEDNRSLMKMGKVCLLIHEVFYECFSMSK